jgi:alkylated DNA repair dioxygenase AlkB
MGTVMTDLFESNEEERLLVTDAEVVLWRTINLENENGFLEQLIEETPWKLEHVTLWGKTYPQPRLVAWYGDNAVTYTYSGVSLTALSWTPELLKLKERVEELCASPFNSVLLNYYRDHRDSMGFHADDEPELGLFPTIASVSIGEERQFVLKHKHHRDIDDIKLPLPSGSLLLMKGATQGNWKHGVPKESKPCGPRVNLTFRNILQEE